MAELQKPEALAHVPDHVFMKLEDLGKDRAEQAFAMSHLPEAWRGFYLDWLAHKQGAA